MAVAEASFKTSMEAISDGFKKLNGLLGPEEPRPRFSELGVVAVLFMGTPSTTNKGELPLRTDPGPLIVMCIAASGAPLEEVTMTPDILPYNNCSGELATPWLKSSLGIDAMAPVTSSFFLVPYPMTSTSSNWVASSSIIMLSALKFETVKVWVFIPK